MSHALTSRLERLKDRSHMLAKVRDFFAKRHVLEVDVPLLSQSAPIDAHIDLISANCLGKKCYLHSSPEYGMKRLLAEGIGDIYQLSHVFRDGEVGEKHEPEFLMAEWYRMGFSYEEIIEDTLAFIRLFVDEPQEEVLTYSEMWSTYTSKKPKDETEEDHIFGFEIEPKLGRKGLTVIKDFPPERAALSQVHDVNGVKVAKRFEIFYKGFELGNGYLELIDAKEQAKRLMEANEKRKSLGKETYPVDKYFLKALETGVPPCAGVACGFDRLMMLRHRVNHIKEVLPIIWHQT